jgi:hypothetical protein
MPISVGPFYNANRPAIEGYQRLMLLPEASILLPTPPGRHALLGLTGPDGQLELGLTDVAAVVAALVLGVRSLRRLRRNASAPLDVAQLAVGAVTAYVLVVGIVLEVGENYRFRSAIEPLVLVVAFAAIGRTVRDRRGASRPQPQPPAPDEAPPAPLDEVAAHPAS